MALTIGNHAIYFKVQDDDDVWSEEVSEGLEVIADIEPPKINILSPKDGEIYVGFDISGSASDNIKVSKVEVSVNNGPFEHATGTTEWTYSVSLIKGTNTVTARATDKAGNTAETTINVYYINPEEYIPYYYFSRGERYHPTSFYFDGDENMENNRENYDAGVGTWDRPYIYLNTVEDGTYFTVQYWLYYSHNPWGGRWFSHEHDWEAVHLVFEKDNLEEPFEVRYAHHNDVYGESFENVQKINTHPIVYVAEDSHASYPRSENVTWYDIWIENSQLAPSDFNLILVDELHQGIWPTYYPGEYGFIYRLPQAPRSFGEAPWIRESWHMTRPNPPEFTELREFMNNTFILGVLGPADLHIYDSKGRHIGVNYSTGEPEIQIPDAIFYSDGEGQVIVVPNSIESRYIIEIVGVGDGTFDFAAFRTVDRAFVFMEEYLNTSTSMGEIHEHILAPSIVSVNKEFKPDHIHTKRKGAVQPRINITNVGEFNISNFKITDYLLPGWNLKNKNSLSFSIYIDGEEHGMQFKAAEISSDEEKVKVEIDFSKGVEITDEEDNKHIIYSLEPNWSLTMKYSMHPPKQIMSGQHIAKVDVEAKTLPLFGHPDGISTIVSNRAVIGVK